MKRNKSNSDTPGKDWEGYSNNFSDLLALSETPKRKRRKKRRSSVLKFDSSVLKSSQDGSINNWSSSEEDKTLHIESNDVPTSPKLIGSAVKNNKHVGRSGSSIKRTPGSPILSQRICSGSPILTPHRFSTARKRTRLTSLLAISPITPGMNRSSFAEKSHFSLHANNETGCERSGFDQTPLAIPLVESDEETVNEFGSTTSTEENNSESTQQDIDVLTTQSQHHQVSSQSDINISLNLFSTQDEEIAVDQNKSDFNGNTDLETKVKGSSWIEGVIEKIDEDCMNLSVPEYSVPASLYDSSKKQKFLRGGMAEQLQRLIRQQKTHYVLFKHQTKLNQNKNKEEFQHSLTLKAISHHKEGILHILECKVLDRGAGVRENEGFYTVILQHDVIVENNINLTTVFTIYPPWKSMNLENHNFPVLLCVENIQVVKGRKTDENGNIQQVRKNDSSTKEVPTSNDSFCESLLTSLEKQSTGNSISLAATIQRIYKQHSHSTKAVRWSMLCEDAFGIFFETELDALLWGDEEWSHLIKHGEGQRVLFQNLYLNGRTTRQQCPSIFSLIDSVWNSDGFGLQQVQDSQSQDSLNTSQSLPNIKPPSFCYKLLARDSLSKLIFSTTSSYENNYSDLNRPTLEGHTCNDVLYKAPALMQYSDEKLCNVTRRCSILCKITHIHNTTDFDDTAFSDHDYVFILDKINPTNRDIVAIKILNEFTENINIGNVVILKDLVHNLEGSFSMDQYSTLVLLHSQSKPSQELDGLCKNIFPALSQSQIEQLSSLKLPRLENITKETSRHSFVNVRGVVYGITTSMSQDKESADRKQTIFTEKICSNDQDLNQDQIEIVVLINLEFKVKIKLLQSTAWKLICDLPCDQKLHPDALNHKIVGPLPCYVYKIESDLMHTVVYTAEVSM